MPLFHLHSPFILILSVVSLRAFCWPAGSHPATFALSLLFLLPNAPSCSNKPCALVWVARGRHRKLGWLTLIATRCLAGETCEADGDAHGYDAGCKANERYKTVGEKRSLHYECDTSCAANANFVSKKKKLNCSSWAWFLENKQHISEGRCPSCLL